MVLCSYTEARWADLVAAVGSLREQTIAPGEVIVVVDHNPALLELVRSRLPDVIAVPNRSQRGLSGARNTGSNVAAGAVIAFIDDDATAAPHWIARLSRHYGAADVLGVGGAAEPQWSPRRPRWFPVEFDWVVGCSYLGMPNEVQPVRNLLGCNMSFRREAFEVAGGFLPHMGRVGARPIGCEETEFCIRAAQRLPGFQFLYDPAAVVHHKVTPSRAQWSYYLSRCFWEGLSKARVSQLVGAADGLSSERAHALRTLPRGVGIGGADAVLRGDAAGLGRAIAILAGFGATAYGYMSEVLRTRLVAARPGVEGSEVPPLA